ncbi:hypothetical protein BG015_000312 [Linnemannia schmuckeri]|uniref:Galactose oxidase n=1 Tax=Linnemannia schmuckeri TaxID=64567 RepID=A0A9P5V7I5_9FUNG|nr:hypothetical protein BG015_000312 [Linnemannia schmuckeri]
MVAVSARRLGLILSLYLSSTLISTTTAQTVTSKPPATGVPTTAPPTPTGTTTPQPPGSVIDAPAAFSGIASASNKKMIYYQGGQLNQAGAAAFSSDLYALDLTKSWPKSTPAWVNLSKANTVASSGPQVSGHAAAMSADGTTLLVTAPWGDGTKPFLYSYHISSGTWSSSAAPAAQAASWTGRKNADLITDPSTGTTYFLGGALADGSSTNEVDAYKDGQWTAPLSLTPAPGVTSLNQFSSGTAILYNSKIFIFGGFSSTVGQRGYQSFQSLPYIDVSNPAAPTHGIQLTLGKYPQPRQDHCTVLTDSKKVLLFGGYDANAKTSLSDLWSLDMITMTWTQILTTNPTTPRHAHTCNIAGANMIVFGGMSSTPSGGQQAYVKDIQVYDVMLSKWMGEYAPKADGTAISEPLDGSNNASSSGLSTGALIGIIIGAIVVLGLAIGFFLYRRRQKQIEIREAEMEKEAYLASLRPEGGDTAGRDSKVSPRVSPNAARAALSTPGMAHNGAYAGMDELLLNNGAGSPGMGGQAQGNVQYLMQHLPDGTIAVQPVYLDHTGGAIQMQSPSPNMQTLAVNSPSPLDQGYISPPGASSGPSVGYFSPPPPAHGSNVTTGGITSPATSPYVLPPTSGSATPMVSYPAPTAPGSKANGSQDPFASPLLGNAPMPPGYANSTHSNVGVSGLGSPQQMHPEQVQHFQH